MIASASAARAEVRALSLINTHTQERATIVFKRNGVYDQQGLQELNRMLRDWRRNEVTRMDPALFDLVWEVYRKTGADEPIHIVSGYRSPATNNMLRSRSRGVAKLSQHMLGRAMDFYLPGVQLSTLRETGMKMQVGGVGFYPTSGSPFVHMDTGSVRAWPRMTRDQLVRLFPDGKTAHVPADGEPLSGYQTALAEVEARKSRGGGATESSSGGGLLAALFGGGSSSSSSYSSASASDDDEEAPAPVQRRQPELRQGPLPPGSAPRVVAAADTAPARVDGPTALPAVLPRAKPIVVAAAEPAPAPAPSAPPMPTATARGSLVAMPVAPAAGEARPLPSRYGPAAQAAPAQTTAAAPGSNGLPPGWVVGPDGRGPVAEAPAPEAPVRVAFTPGLKPVAAPLPVARPGFEREMILAATVGATPIAVTLPRPRPTGAMRVAEADPHAALSAFTGEQDGTEVALGYAPPQQQIFDGPFVTAGVPRDAAAAPQPAPRAETRVAALGGVPMAPAPSAARGKSDRIAAATSRSIGKVDRADVDRLLGSDLRADGADFAVMRHPDQETVSPLLAKPNFTVAARFDFSPDRLGTRRFTGPAVVALPIVRTQ